MRRFSWFLIGFMVLFGLGSACAAEAPGAESTVAAIRHLEPSPLLLKQPDALKADIAVANTPPALDFAIYPAQWAGGKLWSSWGDSLFGTDGNYYASTGDHDGPFGHAYVYVIDPAAKETRLIVDYNAVVGIPKGSYSPGKIHAPICEGGDGWIYFAGYRGSEATASAKYGYIGDWLLRYELKTGNVENLGVMVPHMSIATMRSDPQRGLLYGLCVPGATIAGAKNAFFVYSVKSRSLVFLGGPPSPVCRAIMLARNGHAYYDAGGGAIYHYTPEDNTLQRTRAVLPDGSSLRAASEQGPNGMIYGFTMGGKIFSFDPATEQVTTLCPIFPAGPTYTTTCRLSPGGRYLYYMPGAHGGQRVNGAPVVQLDLKTNQRKVLCFLFDYLREAAQYETGGAFGMALNADGSQLHLNLNGNAPGAGPKALNFGLAAQVIIAIPESERADDRL